MLDPETLNHLYWTLFTIFLVMMWFWQKIEVDLLEQELEELKNMKNDKQVLTELLSRANIEWEEWNDWVVAIDDGYIQAIFNRDGSLRELRSAGE